MSRLYKYLNEKYSPEDRANVITTLLRDCIPYLNEIGVKSKNDFVPSMDLFYRSDKAIALSNGISTKIPVRSGRVPQGTNIKLFPIINKWLKIYGFVPRDKCVIASSSEEHAEAFGLPRLVFPVGPFKYTWIDVVDFNFNGSDYSDCGDGFGLIGLLKDEVVKSVPRALAIYDYQGDVLERGDDYYNQDVLKIMKECSPKERSTLKISVMSMNGEGEATDTIANGDRRASAAKNVFHKLKLSAATTYDTEIGFDCKEYYLVDPLVLGL